MGLVGPPQPPPTLIKCELGKGHENQSQCQNFPFPFAVQDPGPLRAPHSVGTPLLAPFSAYCLRGHL